MNTARLLASAAITSVLVPVAVHAAAQSSPAAPAVAIPDNTVPQPAAAAGTPAAPDGLGDIIVTATRRSENQQRVPITISAFKGETLTNLGVRSTVELPQLTPGLTFIRTASGVNSFLRGIGATNSGYTTEPPVATYIDGLYLPNAGSAAFSFNNIERVEVLKGPQGTLYGRNTVGGLIHVITREPGDTSSIDASVGYANYNTTTFNFYGSTPLSDTIAVNLAATYTKQAKGWGENVFLGTEAFKSKDLGFQAKVLWKPGPDTKVVLRGFYDKLETDQGIAVSIFPGSTGTDGSTYLGEYKLTARRAPSVKQRQYNVSLKIEQGLGFATLTSLTGYINNRSPARFVQNGILGTLTGPAIQGLLFQTAKTFSQELQLTSRQEDSPFQWILGAFYFHDNTLVRGDVSGFCIAGTCAAGLVPTRTSGYANTRSYSAFADLTYSISPTTRITAGVRYTSDRKTFTGLAEPLAGFPNTPAALPASAVLHPGNPFPGNPNGIDTSVTFGKPTYRAVLAQDITPLIHAYASFNRGFKSGGYNPLNFTNPASRPEILDAYEVGLKTELLDRALRLNLSAFYYDYDDVQVRSTAPPAPVGSSLLINAAKARVKGIDMDFLAAPVAGLTINGGLEYLDAKYISFPGLCTSPAPAGGVLSTPCSLAGKRLSGAPKFSYTLGVTYSFEMQVGDFLVNLNDGYKSQFYWEPDNRLSQDSYHLVNGAITWTAKDPRYSVQLFGRNLLGKYYASGAAVNGRNDLYVPGAPRTYGVILRYRY